MEDCWCTYDGNAIDGVVAGSGSGSSLAVSDLEECLIVSIKTIITLKIATLTNCVLLLGYHRS